MLRHPELGAVSGHCRALDTDAGLLARVQEVWCEDQFRITKAAEAALGSVTCVSDPDPLTAFRREAIWNYLPAWAEDRFSVTPERVRVSVDGRLCATVSAGGRPAAEGAGGFALSVRVGGPDAP